jgi:transcriptional regulator with XRE-family HTH domain
MGTVDVSNSPPDGPALDYQQAGPTVLRMLVGAQLRRFREADGITREDAGYAIRASQSKMSRLELGRISFKQRDVADLLTLYGVTDETDRTAVLTMAEQANLPGWWQPYGDAVPAWFEPYLGLEQAAHVIRSYEVQFIPGLLQTEDYARAIIQLGPGRSDEEIERRVELRMRRRQLLHRPHPPKLWVVVDEAALRRPYGSAAAMRAQLRYLIEIAELPHVTVQVMPFSAGGHAAAGGPITILRLSERDLPDVVYLEQLTTALYPDKPAEIDHYWHVMNRLVTEAAPPPATPTIIDEILKEI